MKRRNGTKGFTLVELLVVIGIIALLISILLPSLNRARETANRVKCASNLRQVGTALQLYANDNRGQFPRTVSNAGVTNITFATGTLATDPFANAAASTGQGAAGRPADNDVTAALFLVLRTQDITAEVFTCPSSNAERWDFGGGVNTALNFSNWGWATANNGLGDVKRTLSYSYGVPYAGTTAISAGFKFNNTLSAEYAIAADLNPGISPTSQDNVEAVGTTSSARDMRLGNSNNHDKDGQNVLYGDGHVEFQQNPFVGVARDNIYGRRRDSTAANQFASSFSATGTNMMPNDANDSVLFPSDD
jgi:prepilin-type N-terminal cleavage/methylation domain-containing protein/prepilin-type processing-associated H-X9-DG protein